MFSFFKKQPTKTRSLAPIYKVLEGVKLTDGRSINNAGMIEHLSREGERVTLVLRLTGGVTQEEALHIREEAQRVLEQAEGGMQASVILTQSKAGEMKVPPRTAPQAPTPKPLAGVKHIIAVGAGKGGVGKSTVSVNLAVSLAQLGYKTGLVDADIYGPSVAHMMGLRGHNKPDASEDGRLIPPVHYDVKCMSMGLLVDEGEAMVWRGPILTKALHQLMSGTDWGELDVLVMDLPPGTGDVAISLAQNYTISTALMVATPQDVALLDVRKAVNMLRKVNVPICGIVHNMAYFTDPISHNKTYLFGRGKVERTAMELGVDVVGELPVDPLLSETSDEGAPFVNIYPQYHITQTFHIMADKLMANLTTI